MKLFSVVPAGNADRIAVCFQTLALTGLVSVAGAPGAEAQTSAALSSPGELKKMSLEELLNIEVTTVSKRPEKLTESASAIQVITQDDIRRSGATSIPEALRLAPNLQVAQLDSSDWAISARGFNDVFANKLLVLQVGRSIYTPLFSGVFWDVQVAMVGAIVRFEV